MTAAGSLVVIAYALALVVAGPAADSLIAIALGATLVLLLALVHLGGRVRGAFLGPSVMAAQARQWLAVVGSGVVVAVVLILAAAPLGAALRGASLPVVVIAAALGAVLTVAGVITLLAREGKRATRALRARLTDAVAGVLAHAGSGGRRVFQSVASS